MLAPSLRSSASLPPDRESWLERVRENLAQLLASVHLAHSSANGAPIHVLELEQRRLSRAQSLSLAAHAGIIAGVLLLAAHADMGHRVESTPPLTRFERIIFPGMPAEEIKVGIPSDGNGSGGNRSPIPATRGEIAPLSSKQLAPPWLTNNPNPRLPVAATILDPKVPELQNVPVVPLGLPWMPVYTNSGGPGGPHGIGSTPGRNMGDSKGPFGGRGTSESAYHDGIRPPTCNYCPDPLYTDEARKAKVQGGVTLEVLVGASGQASEIHIARGIGFGLEERALQTVQSWRFQPARDGAGRAVPVWVTVEVSFRLF
jgi:protein TonB